MEWTIRKVVDADYQYPYRHDVHDAEGNFVGTWDIVPKREDGDINGTLINSSYLQPIENYLKEVATNINTLDSGLSQVQIKIDGAYVRISAVESQFSTLAPKLNPVLTNPTANNVPASSNDNSLMTTHEGKKYFDGVMAAYRG